MLKSFSGPDGFDYCFLTGSDSGRPRGRKERLHRRERGQTLRQSHSRPAPGARGLPLRTGIPLGYALTRGPVRGQSGSSRPATGAEPSRSSGAPSPRKTAGSRCPISSGSATRGSAEWDDALLYLEQVVTGGLDSARERQCRLALAYVYTVTGRHKLAEYELERLRESGDESAQVCAFLGYSAWAQGKLDG